MNKVILIGRVGNVETKQMESTFVTKISLATSEKFKNKSGELVESTEWHNCQIWNNKFASEWLKVGDMIVVDGSIHTRKYESDGQTKYSTEIKLKTIQSLVSKRTDGDEQPEQHSAVELDDDGFPF